MLLNALEVFTHEPCVPVVTVLGKLTGVTQGLPDKEANVMNKQCGEG